MNAKRANARHEEPEERTMPKHMAVWLDERKAHIFNIHASTIDEATVMASEHHVRHKDPKRARDAKDEHDEAGRFFHELLLSLDGAEEVLVVGPGKTKLAFLRYVQGYDHALESKIVGLETVEFPTDGQLVTYANAYFKRVDRARLTAT